MTSDELGPTTSSVRSENLICTCPLGPVTTVSPIWMSAPTVNTFVVVPVCSAADCLTPSAVPLAARAGEASSREKSAISALAMGYRLVEFVYMKSSDARIGRPPAGDTIRGALVHKGSVAANRKTPPGGGGWQTIVAFALRATPKNAG